METSGFGDFSSNGRIRRRASSRIGTDARPCQAVHSGPLGGKGGAPHHWGFRRQSPVLPVDRDLVGRAFSAEPTWGTFSLTARRSYGSTITTPCCLFFLSDAGIIS